MHARGPMPGCFATPPLVRIRELVAEILICRRWPPSLLLRLIDDYLIITPSRAAAEAIATRFLQGEHALEMLSSLTTPSSPVSALNIDPYHLQGSCRGHRHPPLQGDRMVACT